MVHSCCLSVRLDISECDSIVVDTEYHRQAVVILAVRKGSGKFLAVVYISGALAVPHLVGIADSLGLVIRNTIEVEKTNVSVSHTQCRVLDDIV